MTPSTAAEIAAQVGGELVGPDRVVSGVGTLEHAGSDDLAYAEDTISAGSDAGVLLVIAAVAGRTCVVVEDPKRAFIDLLGAWFPEVHIAGVQAGASVASDADIHPSASIYPGVFVGSGCAVGADTVLFPGVVLYPGTQIGARCRIHAGCVLGADGFSYHPGAAGPVKVPQVGRVRVADDVEMGPNCCVDRAFLEETVVGPGSKLDNLVHLGHNAQLGRHVIIAAQTGLSGGVVVEDGVMIGGQVGVVEHVRIGAGARVGAQSGVGREVPPGETVLGTPALPIRQMRRVYAALRHLPEIWARVFR